MILNINGAVQAIGLALLVLFFLVGMARTSASLDEVKRPEHCKGRCHLRAGADDGGFHHYSGRCQHHHAVIRNRSDRKDSAAERNGEGHRGLRIFREHSPMGGDADRQSGHHRAVFHHHSHCLRQVFQAVYVHGHRADPALHVCRAPHPECGDQLPEGICGNVSGRSDYRTGLHHIHQVRIHTAGGGCRCCTGSHGMEVRWRARVQHAGAGGIGQDERCHRPGNDGTLILFTAANSGCHFVLPEIKEEFV